MGDAAKRLDGSFSARRWVTQTDQVQYLLDPFVSNQFYRGARLDDGRLSDADSSWFLRYHSYNLCAHLNPDRIGSRDVRRAEQPCFDRTDRTAAITNGYDPDRQVRAAQLLPVEYLAGENFCNVLEPRAPNRIVRMNSQRDVNTGDFKRLQSLERMARIGLAQDFHFPLKGRRNHCKVSPVLQQGQQSEARFVGNDLEVVAGLSFHCRRIRLSEPCSKRG